MQNTPAKNSNSQDLVWYVSYGSNINYDRFIYYIKGGRYRLAGRALPGCTDRSEPRDIRPVVLPFQLYFGDFSPNWQNGGVAFVDDGMTGRTLGRAYLITVEQFYEIVAQETNSEAIAPVKRAQGLITCGVIGEGKYDRIIDCGLLNGYHMRSFTSPTRRRLSPPVDDYLATIAEGLRQTYNLSDSEIGAYFRIQPGIAEDDSRPVAAEPVLAALTNSA